MWPTSANIDIHCDANMHRTMPSNLSTVHCMHESDFIRIRRSPTWQSCLRERPTIPAGTHVPKSARSRLTYFNVRREPIEQPFPSFNKGIIEGTRFRNILQKKTNLLQESTLVNFTSKENDEKKKACLKDLS